MSTMMSIYRHPLSRSTLKGGTADFVSLMSHELHLREKKQQAAQLVDWEQEGGSLATPVGIPQLS